MEINYQIVLSFNQGDARADLQITNLRHADFADLRKMIDALECLISVEKQEISA